jgi:acyl carrier protein
VQERTTVGGALEETVRTVVAKYLDIAPADLTGEALLVDLGVDDALAVRLIGAVGDELDVRFPDDFFDGVDTYGQLTSAVRIAVGV